MSRKLLSFFIQTLGISSNDNKAIMSLFALIYENKKYVFRKIDASEEKGVNTGLNEIIHAGGEETIYMFIDNFFDISFRGFTYYMPLDGHEDNLKSQKMMLKKIYKANDSLGKGYVVCSDFLNLEPKLDDFAQVATFESDKYSWAGKIYSLFYRRNGKIEYIFNKIFSEKNDKELLMITKRYGVIGDGMRTRVCKV